ncbi:hypothetical protein V2J09_005632 [Rumex salicifolius]
MNLKSWMKGKGVRLRRMMKCIFLKKQIKVDEAADSSESLATRDYSTAGFSSRTADGDNDTKTNVSNIEEAESSLRESGYLNYEEARALLGRLEYQKGNMEAAFRVFEGIDVAALMPNMKISLARRCELYRRRSLSQNDSAPLMSMHAITLLLEAIFLKAKSLEALGRMEEAALSCQLILDLVESAIPDGLPEKFANNCKLKETLNKAVELLPGLQKLSGSFNQAILSYRRALLYNWNLELETKSRIEKEFAICLLYTGYDANPPTLRFQMEGSFIPRNNIEEAILLLLILLRKFALTRIKWDPTVLDHLSFALSISGDLQTLVSLMEELPPKIMERKERNLTMALCLHGQGNDSAAMNLIRNLLDDRENLNCTEELLLASKISEGDSYNCPSQAVDYANKAINKLQGKCEYLLSAAFCQLGISLSTHSRSVDSQPRRLSMLSDSLEALEVAKDLGKGRDARVIYHLALENAEQRKLDAALYYAKELLKIEAGSSIGGWILLVRVLSAQKRYVDAETILNAALEQTGKWDQAELLRTKAKLYMVQDQMKNAIQMYTHVLAVLQVRKKGFGVSEKVLKTNREHDRLLEMETWQDLANVYTRLLQWRDAEVCLSKSQALFPYSAARWHCVGLLNQAKGLEKEALESFWRALDTDPTYVPSLISMAKSLMKLGGNQSLASARSFLREAVRLERANASAWYNLGLIYKSEPGSSPLDSIECFEAASLLQDTDPIEPFRLGS